LQPVKAIYQLRGEEILRLIDAGAVLDEAYKSNKTEKQRKTKRLENDTL
jgi:hypothetical protein